MDITQLLKSSGSAALEPFISDTRKQETKPVENIVFSWGKDRVTISQEAKDAYAAQEADNIAGCVSIKPESLLGKRELTAEERALAANDPNASFKMTIGGKTVDIFKALNVPGEDGFKAYADMMNALVNGKTDEFAQILGKAIGVSENDVIAAMKGLDISEVAELASQLSAFTSMEVPAFAKSLSLLTGVDLAAFESGGIVGRLLS